MDSNSAVLFLTKIPKEEYCGVESQLYLAYLLLKGVSQDKLIRVRDDITLTFPPINE